MTYETENDVCDIPEQLESVTSVRDIGERLEAEGD